MPAEVRKVGNKWEIYDKDTGKHKGWSDTEADAQASANARNAVAHGAKLTSKPARKKRRKTLLG